MHHNKTLHKDRVSKRPYKIIFTCSFLWLCSMHSEGWICGWGIRHLHWPIDKEGGCWSVSPWQGVEHTNTSWLWVSNDLFWSQRHGKNMAPHLGRALFHISPLMPVALPTAGVSGVQDSSLKHPHFKTKVPKPFSTWGWFWIQLALDWAVAMWCRKIMQQIGTQWNTWNYCENSRKKYHLVHGNPAQAQHLPCLLKVYLMSFSSFWIALNNMAVALGSLSNWQIFSLQTKKTEGKRNQQCNLNKWRRKKISLKLKTEPQNTWCDGQMHGEKLTHSLKP